jgi:hypothetical protein
MVSSASRVCGSFYSSRATIGSFPSEGLYCLIRHEEPLDISLRGGGLCSFLQRKNYVIFPYSGSLGCGLYI